MPIGGACFCDPKKYNYILKYKLLVFAGIPEHLIFAWYGRWGALDACKILPQGVGTICPHVWEITFPLKNMCGCVFLLFFTCHLQSVAFSMFQTKCHRQNDRTDSGIISLFSWKSDFDMVFSSQIHVLHAKPTFLIVCIIGIILYVQHIQLYIIYEYILSI